MKLKHIIIIALLAVFGAVGELRAESKNGTAEILFREHMADRFKHAKRGVAEYFDLWPKSAKGEATMVLFCLAYADGVNDAHPSENSMARGIVMQRSIRLCMEGIRPLLQE